MRLIVLLYFFIFVINDIYAQSDIIYESADLIDPSLLIPRSSPERKVDTTKSLCFVAAYLGVGYNYFQSLTETSKIPSTFSTWINTALYYKDWQFNIKIPGSFVPTRANEVIEKDSNSYLYTTRIQLGYYPIFLNKRPVRYQISWNRVFAHANQYKTHNECELEITSKELQSVLDQDIILSKFNFKYSPSEKIFSYGFSVYGSMYQFDNNVINAFYLQYSYARQNIKGMDKSFKFTVSLMFEFFRDVDYSLYLFTEYNNDYFYKQKYFRFGLFLFAPAVSDVFLLN